MHDRPITHVAPLVRIYSNENDLGVVDIRATIFAGLSEAEVVAALGYDPEADVENTPDSVFCAHGAGFNVKWHH